MELGPEIGNDSCCLKQNLLEINCAGLCSLPEMTKPKVNSGCRLFPFCLDWASDAVPDKKMEGKPCKHTGEKRKKTFKYIYLKH